MVQKVLRQTFIDEASWLWINEMKLPKPNWRAQMVFQVKKKVQYQLVNFIFNQFSFKIRFKLVKNLT